MYKSRLSRRAGNRTAKRTDCHGGRRQVITRMVLACVLTASALLGAVSANGPADTLSVQAELTNDSIREKEEQVKAIQEERARIQSSISDIKKIKEELENSKASLNTYITELDSKVTRMQATIDTLTESIEETENAIEETKVELAAAEEKERSQYNGMKRRVKFLYERGEDYYLEAFLNAGSISDLLTRQMYIEKLSEYDSNMLAEYVAQRELVELTKQQLEEEQAALEESKAAVEAEKESIEQLIKEKQAQIAALNGQIAAQEQDLASYQAAVAQRDSEISALEAAVRAEKAKLAAANQPHYSGGVFVWPAPSYTYISSEFGYRTSPTAGASTFHSGLDMASPHGSPILAAAEGNVVAASYSSSMGNYVMIDHGDGLYTVYMHASALYVSSGQYVTAGQQIAAVGSTGISTGPHLHFSVRLNGTYVNPWGYLR